MCIVFQNTLFHHFDVAKKSIFHYLGVCGDNLPFAALDKHHTSQVGSELLNVGHVWGE